MSDTCLPKKSLRGDVTSRNGAISAAFRDAYERLGSWSAVARAFGVSKALAWRIANEGYVPRNQALRRRLGLLQPRDLFALSPRELRWMLEHRVEV